MATAIRATTTANTAAIMSTDATTKDRRLKWVIAAAALLIGGSLVLMAVPRIAAYGFVLSAGAVIQAVDDGRGVSQEQAEAAYRSYSQALAWRPRDPVLRHDRARLAGRLAVLEPRSAAQWRERAVRDFRRAVAAAPGDGTAWARLALAELEAGADIKEVLPMLRLARLTAPRRASALLPQFSIVMRHWEAMPEEMRTHALADLPSFWSRGALRPLIVADYLNAGYAARAAFRERLGENAGALNAFDRALASSFRG